MEMRKTEARARADMAVPDGGDPAAEVKTALSAFVNDFKEFQRDFFIINQPLLKFILDKVFIDY